ncbi:28S ribosomal protein S31, mitochondrial [Chelonus insularis]|uniref:28S ribosomal protein S31, mitochondrial n=1 Tax=Chelonus insularis TaxID=460826 RepID=UPI00158A3701|nr:28S ribosomal protein S31, mitochondrial [Chelonus insularis]
MNTILTMHLIYRRILTLRTVNKQYLHSSVNVMSAKDSSSDSSSSDSDSDDDKSKKEIKKQPENIPSKTNKESIDSLNNLLTKMITETSASRTFRSAPKRIKEPKPLEKPTLEQSIITAAKETADYLGGDTEKTRQELVDKVFSTRIPPQAPGTEDTKKKIPKESKDTKAGSEISLSELLSGMKIERTQDKPLPQSKYSRSSKIEELSKRFQQHGSGMISLRVKEVSVNLFGGKRLGIFDEIQEDIIATQNQEIPIWRALEQKELKLLLEHPPENIFQEMIQWTETGLLWKFPINNEYGYEEEESVPFSEHVFMERHIEDWCPKVGPIRHFMELVCIGLSKNPYMKVQEKIDHLMWYKNFFGERQELLKEINVIKEDILPSKSSKQIEA